MQTLLGALAAVGLVAIGFGLGSDTAAAQERPDSGSMRGMIETCERHMDEMRPMMDNMMGSESMDNMMESGGMGS